MPKHAGFARSDGEDIFEITGPSIHLLSINSSLWSIIQFESKFEAQKKHSRGCNNKWSCRIIYLIVVYTSVASQP
jgi:hypothetical protein